MPTQLALAELTEAERELRLQKFAIDEHAIVAITNPAGVITYVNDKFCAISKYAREELLGQTHKIISSGHHPKPFFAEMWKTIASGETWKGEICNRAKNGSIYWVDTTIVPFKDDHGVVVQYVAIRADITNRKELEDQLRRANAELEQFVCTASHDLKSPLLTIEGFSGFMSRYIECEQYDKLQECVERISGAVHRMRANIDDLLELSRIGRVIQDHDDVDLRPLLRDLVTEFDLQISNNNALVTIHENLPLVRCDPIRLKQLFANLLSNALKYGRPEDGVFKIALGAKRAGDEIRLFVSDNGPGIEGAYREKVFGLFHRLDNTAEGTGVGLNIVKRIADVHNGRAWVESTPGGGATIVVALPVPSDDAAALQSTQNHSQ